MKGLLLGCKARDLARHLPEWDLAFFDDKLDITRVEFIRPDWILSFGYRHVLSSPILDQVGGRALNLHISLLPWNRGADPNLWSWLEDTPKGVSVHWMSPQLDKGEIAAQLPVALDPLLTLRQAYATLMGEITELFAQIVPEIEMGAVPRIRQPPGGTYHRASDKDAHSGALPMGWDTPCHRVREYGDAHRLTIRN